MAGMERTLGIGARLLAGILLACAVAASATADVADRAEVYGALPDIGIMAISPDGATVAWRNTTDTSDAIIIYSLADRKVIGGVSLDEEIRPSSLLFATDDKLVLVVSEHGRISGFMGKYDVSSAWVYNLVTRDMQPLLVRGGIVYTGQSGLGEIVGLSSDGTHVYMPAFAGNAESVRVPSYSLFEVDLETPRKLNIHFAGARRSRDFLVGADGEAFVHEYFEDNGQRHVVAVRKDGDWKKIYTRDTALPEINLVGVSADYESLVVAAFDDATRRAQYYAMSVNSGEITGTLFGREDADVANVYTDINRVVYGVRYSGFNPSYEFLDDTVTERLDAITRLVDGNSVWLSDWTRDWRTLLVLVEGSAFSGQYFTLTEGKEPAMLANVRPRFDDATIHPIAQFSYTAADGLKIPALLTIPAGKVDDLTNLPAVVVPHGGPATYDSIEFDWFAQALADRGYLVIQPQFRGSTGFGLDHLTAGYGEWGRKMQTDLSDGLTALAAKGYIDPSRVCIAGMSYGGYAALAAGAYQSGIYRCAVSINGVSDLNGMIDYNEFWVRDNEMSMAYFAETFGAGEIDRKYLKSVSPVESADTFAVPVLLVHSVDDKVVPVRQSERMHAKLRKAGKDVTYIELEDDGHNLAARESRVQILRATYEFLDRNLASAP